jgi:hypothetical protein
MKITKVQVVTEWAGCDYIYLETDLPSAVWPYEGTQTAKLTAAAGTGVDYARANFPGIPKEILDLRQDGPKAVFTPFE